MSSDFAPLSLLKHASECRSFLPTIVVDSREQTPLIFSRLAARYLRGEEGEGLTSGDYSISGLEDQFAIERKSVADLVASVTRERDRFSRELHRLRGYRFARVVVTGTRAQIAAGEYRSRANPVAVLHSISALEARYGIPFVFAGDEHRAAGAIEGWAYWFARAIVDETNDLIRGIRATAAAPAPSEPPAPGAANGASVIAA